MCCFSVITTTREEPEYFRYGHCGCDVQSLTLLVVLPSKVDFVHNNQMRNKIEQVLEEVMVFICVCIEAA